MDTYYQSYGLNLKMCVVDTRLIVNFAKPHKKKKSANGGRTHYSHQQQNNGKNTTKDKSLYRLVRSSVSLFPDMSNLLKQQASQSVSRTQRPVRLSFSQPAIESLNFRAVIQSFSYSVIHSIRYSVVIEWHDLLTSMNKY